MFRFRLAGVLLALGLSLVACPAALAFQWSCYPCAAVSQPVCQTVERTVMVPEMVTENRTVQVVECRAEQRQCTYLVYRPVPETRVVQCEVIVPRYEMQTREISYTVCRPVMSTEECAYTVMVPHTEVRQGTRMVCRMVPIVQTQAVCEDQGCWQAVPSGGGCQPCTVWVPKIVQREVQYTVLRPQSEEVPYQFNYTVYKPETRVATVQICNYVQELQTRQVQYPVCVPERRVISREVTTCRLVAEQQTSTYVVQVPYTTERQVQVQVCRMVPKTIACQVPVNAGSVSNGCCCW